ncbi:MAG: GyrI-like domain-containing protein [Planctomycetota bacterium]
MNTPRLLLAGLTLLAASLPLACRCTDCGETEPTAFQAPQMQLQYIDEPEIVNFAGQATAIKHLVIPKDQIQAAMGPAIGEVWGAVASQGMQPAGPVFSRHFGLFPDKWDFEVGLPIAGTLEARGEVQQSELPAGRVLKATYTGNYDGLGDAWGELTTWAERAGLKGNGTVWESYAYGPESTQDPSEWRTELFLPLQ